MDEARSADTCTQKCTLHIRPFGFASAHQGMVPKCLMETTGSLQTGVGGQQAMCASQNPGLTDFRPEIRFEPLLSLSGWL